MNDKKRRRFEVLGLYSLEHRELMTVGEGLLTTSGGGAAAAMSRMAASDVRIGVGTDSTTHPDAVVDGNVVRVLSPDGQTATIVPFHGRGRALWTTVADTTGDHVPELVVTGYSRGRYRLAVYDLNTLAPVSRRLAGADLFPGMNRYAGEARFFVSDVVQTSQGDEIVARIGLPHGRFLERTFHAGSGRFLKARRVEAPALTAPAPITVSVGVGTDIGSLPWAIRKVATSDDSLAYTIQVDSQSIDTITMPGQQLIYVDLTIVGNGVTIDMQHQDRAFFVMGGNVTFSDMTITNGLANGGNGGDGGGGGAGMGGAIFVTNVANIPGTYDVQKTTYLTLEKVKLVGNEARGGDGGTFDAVTLPLPWTQAGGAGGGGGMGGNGGYSADSQNDPNKDKHHGGGGGGGFGNGADGGTGGSSSNLDIYDTFGKAGGLYWKSTSNADHAGDGLIDGIVMPNGASFGGGGGGGLNGYGAGGGGARGSNAIAGDQSSRDGGDGGWGGGGGGGVTGGGGNGGFGGGGGGSHKSRQEPGGQGGFGGGGGAGTAGSGLPGFGGGRAGIMDQGNSIWIGSGGGGAAMGGGLFVDWAGPNAANPLIFVNLIDTILGGELPTDKNKSTEGVPTADGLLSGAQKGQPLGTDIFLRGPVSIEAGPSFLSSSMKIYDTIASDPAAPNASISKTGVGTLEIHGHNSFSGGVKLFQGRIDVTDDSSLGTGPLIASSIDKNPVVLGIPAESTRIGLVNAISIGSGTTMQIDTPFRSILSLGVPIAMQSSSTLMKTGPGGISITTNDQKNQLPGSIVVSDGEVTVTGTQNGSTGPIRIDTSATTHGTLSFSEFSVVTPSLAGSGTLRLLNTSGITTSDASAFTGTISVEGVANILATGIGGTISLKPNTEAHVRGVINSAITGSGDLYVDSYSGRTTLNGDLSGFTGRIFVNSPTTIAQSVPHAASLIIGSGTSLTVKGSVTTPISGSGSLSVDPGSGQTITLNDLSAFQENLSIQSGTVILRGPLRPNLNVTVASGAYLIIQGPADDLVLGGSGTVTFDTGPGTTVVNHSLGLTSNTFTGNLRVMSGTLSLPNGNANSKTNLSVFKNATLATQGDLAGVILSQGTLLVSRPSGSISIPQGLRLFDGTLRVDQNTILNLPQNQIISAAKIDLAAGSLLEISQNLKSRQTLSGTGTLYVNTSTTTDAFEPVMNSFSGMIAVKPETAGTSLTLTKGLPASVTLEIMANASVTTFGSINGVILAAPRASLKVAAKANVILGNDQANTIIDAQLVIGDGATAELRSTSPFRTLGLVLGQGASLKTGAAELLENVVAQLGANATWRASSIIVDTNARIVGDQGGASVYAATISNQGVFEGPPMDAGTIFFRPRLDIYAVVSGSENHVGRVVFHAPKN